MKLLIKKNLEKIQNKIYNLSKYYNRNPKNINLLLASKSRSVYEIKFANEYNQNNFGENYVQEAIKKIVWFKKNHPKNNLIWHMIGQIQSNKSKLIAKYFDWCHTINNIKISKKLNNYRKIKKKPLKVLIQININEEKNRYGSSLKEFDNIYEFIFQKCNNLMLKGIMIFPIITDDLNKKIYNFNIIIDKFNTLKNKNSNFNVLSFGTTSDIDHAIKIGSTLLRIGKGIFENKK
ncbi:yggS [Wigglesworthia glossinidia endosymbiont of Glossina brevipalpis]|uniref:Pyridoxal phosphate homeostasis protein n=1 Tax=Wigglesworthia glossinidia brevipalpis TaxID=36870 RepID=Q8D3C1_WIGBR|nr:yggS [Wigglesworthia glossinidia endosymbiont of Glossina brevipalpis]